MSALREVGSRKPEAGSRRPNQPALLTSSSGLSPTPDPGPQRPWLLLLDDQVAPRNAGEGRAGFSRVVIDMIKRPNAVIRLGLPRDDGGYGTDLRWSLQLVEPFPEDALLGPVCKRLNELINANLRYTVGQ